VTSKRQVTIPKEVADRYAIEPGDEIRWLPAGREIRVLPPGLAADGPLALQDRLALFDRATGRRDARSAIGPAESVVDRGWTRDELYDRGHAR